MSGCLVAMHMYLVFMLLSPVTVIQSNTSASKLLILKVLDASRNSWKIFAAHFEKLCFKTKKHGVFLLTLCCLTSETVWASVLDKFSHDSNDL